MLDSLGMTVADLVALVSVLIGIGFGYRQGLSGQMTILLTLLAVWFSLTRGFEPLHAWMVTHLSLPHNNAEMATRLVLAIVPVLLGMGLYVGLRYVFKITFTTWFDRIGGALAGGLTSAGIILLLFMLINELPDNQRPEMVGPKSWISRTVTGTETQWLHSILMRIEKGEGAIERVRESKAGKREKWEE